MKPLSLNLSKVKKIGGDGKSTTFMHPDGHRITVAHAPLSALQIKQMEKMPIAKMADGGDPVNTEVESVDPNIPENQASENISDQRLQEDPQREPAAQQNIQSQPVVQQEGPGPSISSAYESEKRANLAGAKAIGEQGQKEAAATYEAGQKIEELPTQNDIVENNRQKSQSLFDAYQKQELDPDKYWENHSKIAAGVAMILGGAGIGANGVNPGVEAVNLGINREIEKQKNSQEQKMNLWKMNRQALGDDLSANLATQNQYLVGFKFKLDKAAAEAKGPIALAAAQAANSKIDQALAINYNKMALHAGLTQRAGDGSEQSFVNNLNNAHQYAPELAKDAQSKYIPGVGVSKIPLAPEDRSSITSLDNLEKQLDRAVDFAKTNGTTLPGQVKNQEAADIQNGIQLEIGNLMGLKRINEFEAKKYTDLAGNPGAFRTKAAIQSFNDLKHDIAIKRQAMLSNLSVTPFKKSDQRQVALQWARQNPNDPRAAKIIQSVNSGSTGQW